MLQRNEQDKSTDLVIDKASLEDAAGIIDYLNVVGGESDNLLFGKNEIGISVEQEQRFIEDMNNNLRSVMLVGKMDGNIVAIGSLTGFARQRIAHRGEIAISVKRDYWGRGIGTRMMQELIRFGGEAAGMEVIELKVRSDNERAIRLYEDLGFKKIGYYEKFVKIEGKDYDALLMNLYL